MALSQDFEARRRERLRQQHIKRERMRKIRKLIGLLLLVLVVVIVISNIVKCAKKPNEQTQAPTNTTLATQEPKDSSFDPQIPEPKKGKNNYLDVIKSSGQTKHVYLTFDDGPSKTVTPEILDVLRRYNIKATFFMTGEEIEENPYLCTRAMEEGHLVLPLSYSNDPDTLYADKTTFMDEVEETYKLIVKNSPSTMKPVKIYRFLGGGYENTSFGADKQEYKNELAKEGYYYCDWNTTIGDSNSSRTPEQLLNYFTSNIPPLNNLIIQMHNTDRNSATAKVLGDLIEHLFDDGYTFSRLDEIEFSSEVEDEDIEDEEEPTKAPEEGKATEKPQEEATEKPKKTSAPTTPKPTDKPEATKKPETTKKPEATKKPAVVTEPPKTATLPPKNNNEIESE